jgi:hypothetical protein
MKHFEKTEIIFIVSVLVVMSLIFLTACTTKTIDTSVNVQLDSDGSISDYTLTTTMSEAQYNELKSKAMSQGYSSVREYFLRDFNGASDYFEYNEPSMNSGKKITLSNVRKVDTAHTLKSIVIYGQNNQIFFNDTTFSSDYLFPRTNIKQLDYTLDSAVKIQKHNANSQAKDHFSVSWTYKEDQNIPTLYMITEPVSSTTKKTPGFETIISIISLCIIGLIVRNHRKSKSKKIS